MKLNRLLIIPARKGSKRIKNKNFLIFNKKKIIEYSIELAISSKIFSEIHISTDDKINGKKLIRKGITVDYNRPKYLSNDKVSLMNVFNYVVNCYKNKNIFFNEIWFLSACSPLILAKDLENSSKLFKKSKANLLLSVCKYSQPVERSFYKKNNKLYPHYNKSLRLNTQNFKHSYFHTGNFSAFKGQFFYKKKVKKIYTGYELPIWRSVDIDNENDLNLTKIFYKNLIKQ